jgi:hypothetical protein
VTTKLHAYTVTIVAHLRRWSISIDLTLSIDRTDLCKAPSIYVHLNINLAGFQHPVNSDNDRDLSRRFQQGPAEWWLQFIDHLLCCSAFACGDSSLSLVERTIGITLKGPRLTVPDRSIHERHPFDVQPRSDIIDRDTGPVVFPAVLDPY